MTGFRKLIDTEENKNAMLISKKTLSQSGMLLGAVQALGGLLGCLFQSRIEFHLDFVFILLRGWIL